MKLGFILTSIVIAAIGLMLGITFIQSNEKDYLENDFEKFFDEPAEPGILDGLAQKNRELAVWDKMKGVAFSISYKTILVESMMEELKSHHSSDKILEINKLSSEIDVEKKRLTTMLYLANEFANTDDGEPSSKYGVLWRALSDPEIPYNWIGVYADINNFKPK